MNNKAYAEYVAGMMPKSPLWKDLLLAYLSGGLLCVVGQLIINLYVLLGMDGEAASGAASVSMVFFGALLTGLGVYDKLGRHCGAGTLVPITGFANSVASPAIEFKREGLVAGMAAKMFVIAGPVLVFGLSASVLYGVILVLLGK